jgi:tRNA threonylcarbamoyladenosine biosynthesis protein TsaB
MDNLARESGIRLRECNAVAVSIGPGSFTGLRVGVACAKTLAYATGCQLTAVDTFLCIANTSPSDVDKVAVIGDAQRGDLYVGHYLRGKDGLFVRVGEIAIVNARQWGRSRSADEIISGPGIDKYVDVLPRACRILETKFRHPQAAGVAQLGERQIISGDVADLWKLEPFYLRPSAAEEKRAASGR